MCTKASSELSGVAELVSGIVQGSVLRPIMFLAYINKLAAILHKHGIFVHLFADDVKLYLKILNVLDIVQLQGALNNLVQWADRWQLSLSVDKCYLLNIGILKFDTILTVRGVALPVVQSQRDLGVIVSSDLLPTLHINDIVVKAHRRANLILWAFESRNVCLPFTCLFSVRQTSCRIQLCYLVTLYYKGYFGHRKRTEAFH